MSTTTFSLLIFGLLTALPRLAAAQLYDARPGPVNYEKRERPAVKLLVDGPAEATRSYLQDWLKDTYNVRLKSGGIAGFGKSATLTAKQASVSPISSKLINLYATVTSATDSTAEVALFGGFDDKTFFDEASTPTEFAALRGVAQRFAGAARAKIYRDQVAEAEKQVREVEKEKEKLEGNVQKRKASTVSNLKRIEELKAENIANRQQVRQDSLQLLKNVDLRRTSELRLQSRRARLSTLGQKN